MSLIWDAQYCSMGLNGRFQERQLKIPIRPVLKGTVVILLEKTTVCKLPKTALSTLKYDAFLLIY
jgi:hypothetical protein